MGAQEEYFHASLRHAVGVRRLSSGEAKRILALLDKADKDLQKRLNNRLVPGTSFQTKRWQQLLRDIRALRKTLFLELRKTHRAQLLEIAQAEQEFALGLLKAKIPVEIDFASVDAQQLRTTVTQTPFAGGANAARTLDQWWSGLAAIDNQRITSALQLGMAQGETVPQMMARIRSVAGLTRANAEAIVRTGVNHATTTARDQFFAANSDIVGIERWLSTLDGRTSAVCRARDGHFAPVPGSTAPVPEPRLEPPTARPPAHPSCRSTMVGHLNSEGIAARLPERPFVRDARTGRQRERDFRAEARATAGARWKQMDAKARNAAIRRAKSAWAAEAVGQVPGAMNYDQWLRAQPPSFQNQVLGVRKAQAFRKGLKLDQFVDRKGQELTLPQLKALFPTYL